MVKRKADGAAAGGSGRGKAKAVSRPPHPPRRNETNDVDDDDSDFCEIIEPPPRSTRTSNASSSSGTNTNRGMSRVGITRAPASGGAHLGFPAMMHHGQNVAGSQGAVLSMLAAAGLSNSYSMQHHYDMQPSNSNHGGMLQMQMPQQMGGFMPGLPGQAFAFGGSAELYVPPVPAGFQNQGYNMAGFVAPQTAMPPPAVGKPHANATHGELLCRHNCSIVRYRLNT